MNSTLESLKSHFQQYKRVAHEGDPDDNFYHKIIADISPTTANEVIIKEVIKEVPVEVIKEVIKEVQVPTETIPSDFLTLLDKNNKIISKINIEKKQLEMDNELKLQELNSLNNSYIHALQENEKLSQDNDIFYQQMSDKERTITDLQAKINALEKQYQDEISRLELTIKNMIPTPKKNISVTQSDVPPPLIPLSTTSLKTTLPRKSSLPKTKPFK